MLGSPKSKKSTVAELQREAKEGELPALPDCLSMAGKELAQPHGNWLLGEAAGTWTMAGKPTGCQSAHLPAAQRSNTLPWAGSPGRSEDAMDDPTDERRQCCCADTRFLHGREKSGLSTVATADGLKGADLTLILLTLHVTSKNTQVSQDRERAA